MISELRNKALRMTCIAVAGWFQPPGSGTPVVNGSTSYSANGQLVPPQACVGTAACPQTHYVGSGWSQWTSLSSGGECGLAYKILPLLDTDQVCCMS